MPEGAFILNSNVRYYTARTLPNGEAVIDTVMPFDERTSHCRFDPARARVVIVKPEQLMDVFDGGCYVLTLRYSLTRRKVLSFRCGGVA